MVRDMVTSDSDKTLLLMQIIVYGEYVLSDIFITNFYDKTDVGRVFELVLYTIWLQKNSIKQN